MGGYGFFYIAGEGLVDCGRGVFWQKRNALLDGATRRGRRMHHGHWLGAVLDDHFCAGTDMGQQGCEIPRCLAD
jgi:hypothetical protein